MEQPKLYISLESDAGHLVVTGPLVLFERFVQAMAPAMAHLSTDQKESSAFVQPAEQPA